MDPKGMVDGPNMYQYCGGDPVNCWDPMGTKIVVAGKEQKGVPLYEDLTEVEMDVMGKMISSSKTWKFTSQEQMIHNIKKFASDYALEVGYTLDGIKAIIEARSERAKIAGAKAWALHSHNLDKRLTQAARRHEFYAFARGKSFGQAQDEFRETQAANAQASFDEVVDMGLTILDYDNAVLELTTGIGYEGYYSKIGKTTYEGVRANETYRQLYKRQADIQSERALRTATLYFAPLALKELKVAFAGSVARTPPFASAAMRDLVDDWRSGKITQVEFNARHMEMIHEYYGGQNMVAMANGSGGPKTVMVDINKPAYPLDARLQGVALENTYIFILQLLLLLGPLLSFFGDVG